MLGLKLKCVHDSTWAHFEGLSSASRTFLGLKETFQIQVASMISPVDTPDTIWAWFGTPLRLASSWSAGLLEWLETGRCGWLVGHHHLVCRYQTRSWCGSHPSTPFWLSFLAMTKGSLCWFLGTSKWGVFALSGVKRDGEELHNSGFLSILSTSTLLKWLFLVLHSWADRL